MRKPVNWQYFCLHTREIMTFNAFKAQYDVEGAVCVFFGSQDVNSEDQNAIEELAKTLAERTENMVFRSGASQGAETVFCNAISEVDEEILEVFTPYRGFRDGSLPTPYVFSIEDFELYDQESLIYHAKQHKKFGPIIGQVVGGNVHKGNIGASFVVRDMAMLTGIEDFTPATVVFLYLDPTKKNGGIHQFIMERCMALNIPYFDQRSWMPLLETVV